MTAVRKFQPANAHHLRVIKGGKSSTKKTRSTEHMVANAWLFAQASLWDGQVFTDAEITRFKKLINEFFEEHEFSEDTFVEFCERVILAKRYVARSSFRYIAAPINWLNIHFKYGISGTERWYREVEQQRETAPEYNKGITILSIAVASYTANPTLNVYRSCRSQLIEQKQYDLLPVFNSLVTAFHYLNS
jgi:hypothetical protein